MIKLFNTLGKKKQTFKPIKDNEIGVYSCGPTVYWYAHIGNMRSYIFADTLKRVLLYNGYKVKHVMNLTDVGHLTSDADTGEEKMEVAAKREHKSAWQIAEFYAKAFFEDEERLNIIKPDVICKATDYIKEMIELVKKLEDKGYTYRIDDGIYFDTSKLKDYGKLAGLDIKGLKAGARVEMAEGKKNATDFALWKFSPKDKKREMEWNSPWDIGFPGWHIECSAMSMKHLGEHFDIHTGGIDHIPVHHTNEIAQSEAATGKKFVNYWLHGAFLQLKEGKMSKSEGNILRLDNLIEEGFDPIAYRYLVLTAHYRSPLVYSKEGLSACQISLERLREFVKRLKEIDNKAVNKTYPKLILKTKKEFKNAVNDDLNTPMALAVISDFMRETNKLIGEKKIGKLQAKKAYEMMIDFDKVLGLKLGEAKEEKISKEIMKLIEEREEARKKKDFAKADKIRDELNKMGVQLNDTKDGVKWRIVNK